MAAARLVAGRNTGLTVAASATSFQALAQCALSFTTPESSRYITYRTAGTLTRLTAQKSAGNRTGMSAAVNVNGSAGSGALAFTNTNGEYEDVSGSDSISAGQTVSCAIAGGATGNTNLTITLIAVNWEATGTTTNHMATIMSGLAFATASQTSYRPPAGNDGVNTTTQANGEWLVKLPPGVDHITIQNLHVQVTANSRTTNTVISINGASGPGTAPSVTYGSTETGLKEDTSNSIQAKDGDKISIKVVTGNDASHSLTVVMAAVEVQSDNGVFHFVNSNPNGASLGTSSFAALGMDLNQNGTTESGLKAKSDLTGTPCVLSLLSAYVKTGGTSSAVRLRANGADAGSPSAVNVATTSSGAWVTDSANTYNAVSSDELNYSSAFGTVAAAVTCIAITVKQGAAPPFSPRTPRNFLLRR